MKKITKYFFEILEIFTCWLFSIFIYIWYNAKYVVNYIKDRNRYDLFGEGEEEWNRIW